MEVFATEKLLIRVSCTRIGSAPEAKRTHSSIRIASPRVENSLEFNQFTDNGCCAFTSSGSSVSPFDTLIGGMISDLSRRTRDIQN